MDRPSLSVSFRSGQLSEFLALFKFLNFVLLIYLLGKKEMERALEAKDNE